MVQIIEIKTIFEEGILKTKIGKKVGPSNIDNVVNLATIK